MELPLPRPVELMEEQHERRRDQLRAAHEEHLGPTPETFEELLDSLVRRWIWMRAVLTEVGLFPGIACPASHDRLHLPLPYPY